MVAFKLSYGGISILHYEKGIRFIIITGMSGAGKSLAIKCLEDLGYFCIDNLPAALIPKFAELCNQTGGGIERVALGIDVREGEFLEGLFDILNDLREAGHEVTILFLESTDETLVKRFSETRRPHPLAGEGSVLEGIKLERQILSGLKREADLVLETSQLHVHELRKWIADTFQEPERPKRTVLSLVSFGYKFGLPYDADLIFDVRFLPNPHFREELRVLTGKDQAVMDFVLANPQTQAYLEKLLDFLHYSLPLYLQEGKAYLTISVGCTGGRHRSVSIVEYLGEKLREWSHEVALRHRDIDKEG